MSLSSDGIEFHNLTPLYEKHWWAVAVLHLGIWRSLQFLVFLSWTSERFANIETKKCGASEFMHLYISVASRRYNASEIGNSLSSFSVGVMCSYFFFPDKMRAAKFCTSCNLEILLLLVPDHILELNFLGNESSLLAT